MLLVNKEEKNTEKKKDNAYKSKETHKVQKLRVKKQITLIKQY